MPPIRIVLNTLLALPVLLLVIAGSSGQIEDTTVGEIDSIALETDEPKAETPAVEDLKTEGTTTVEITTPAPFQSSTSLYKLRAANDAVCILLQVDALLTFKYITKLGVEEEADAYTPDQLSTSGTCNEDDASLNLKWLSYNLRWEFAKTPGGERWYVDRIQLSYNTSEPIFKHHSKPGRFVMLSTSRQHSAMLFPTPVGKSFACAEETSVVVKEGKSGSATATILLRDLRVQPFIFKNDQFGPEYICSPGGPGAFRSETAPLAVGSTFAVMVLGTVTGYGVYRYFKIKKVEYGTME